MASSSIRTIPWRNIAILGLALLLQACGGSSDAPGPEPVIQKGFGPSELFHPGTNPNGHVLGEGDTGVIILAASDARAVWFEIAQAATYDFEMEDEDLAVLARAELRDANDASLLAVDAVRRTGSARLNPGRYALYLTASAANPESTSTPLFVRFDSHGAGASGKPAPRANANANANANDVNRLLGIRSCADCNLSGANLSGAKLSLANLSRANLSTANLSGAKLALAILSGANLSGANLSGANLMGAKLSGVNLGLAILNSADLSTANLSGANLSGANLSGANLFMANLSGVNLGLAILNNADLSTANLSGANLSGANLSGANLFMANLSNALWVDGRRCGPNSIGSCKP